MMVEKTKSSVLTLKKKNTPKVNFWLQFYMTQVTSGNAVKGGKRRRRYNKVLNFDSFIKEFYLNA